MIIERLPHWLLFGALLIDLAIGEVPDKIHPVVWMGHYIKFLWDKRIGRSKAALFFSGTIILLSGGVIFYFLPWVIIRSIPIVLGFLLSLFLLTTVFSMKALIKAAHEVQKALSTNDLPEARQLTSWHLVSRDTSNLSEEEIVSAVIESVAENITDGFASPLLYFSLGGIPAAWAYRFINTADSMIAYRSGDFEWGGKVAALVDDLANWLPARLSGLFICAAAFIQKENWRTSFKVMKEQRKATASPNAGWTMAAMAGALNIKLEKKGEYLLDGGSESRDFQLIDRAVKILTKAMMLVIMFNFFLLEVFYWLNI